MNDIMPWLTVASTYIHRNPFLTLRQDTREAPGFGQHNFYILEFPDWANVVAVTKDDELILVRQFRHGLAQVNLEIPGGIVDPGEKPEATAVRELWEETGYSPEHLEILTSVSVNPAIQNNWCHLYLATGCRRVGNQRLDGTESIAVELVPLRELLDLLAAGRIHHSLNYLALTLAHNKLSAQ